MDGDIVQMRAERREPTLEIAADPCLQGLDGRGSALVCERRTVEAELAGPFREQRVEQCERLLTRGDELRAQLRDLLRPGRKRVAIRGAGGDAAQRGVAGCDSAAP